MPTARVPRQSGTGLAVPLLTKRLRLRPLTGGDLDDLVELDSDPAVMRYLTGQPTDRHRMIAEVLPRMLRNCRDGLGYWTASTRGNGQFIGWFALTPAGPKAAELGYRLRRSAWGFGYATEGSLALLDRGFADLGLHRVQAGTMAVNLRSRRVMERVGLSYLRTVFLDWTDPLPGTEQGEVEYAMHRADWQARQWIR